MVLRCTLLLALTVGTLAGPMRRADSRTCASTCPDGDWKFGMTEGMTYTYAYTANVKTSMVGASEDHSSLHIVASAGVEVLSRCEMALTLADVDLLDSDPRDINTRQQVPNAGAFRAAIQAKPLRFAFIDGHIESICSEPDEPVWVLNLKRGILSSIQNTMTRWDTAENKIDVDISGKCPVSYKRTSNGFTTDTITKVKDMLACQDGHDQDTVFHGLPYTTDSRMQSLPLMDSSHECEQDVTSEGVLSRVSCREVHRFRPFSTQTSGAVTEVTSSLIYRSKSSGTTTRQGPIQMQSDLIFDRTPTPEERADSFREALDTLRQICGSITNDVRPEVPGQFMRLVHDMRKLDSSNLLILYRKTSNACPKSAKFFRDALGNLGSAAGVSVIRDLVQRGEVSDMEAEIWLTSLAFVGRPSLELLGEASSLLSLSGPGTGRKAHLAVSSLVYNYCHLDSKCGEKRQVMQIVRIFEDSLNYCQGDHEQSILALKSLGNTGQGTRSTNVLSRCIVTDSVPMEVRVEAIKAWRRLPCSVDRSDLMNVYTDKRQDAELRIHAYLQVMKCPSSDVIARVRNQLENEKVNQVGSFVWTHLTNLIESSDPFKKEIGDILASEPLARRFDLDGRKFSRNMEWSMFSNMLNTGGVVESNLIWSEKSFVPRSLNLNLTLNMFGHAMNVLELGGRAQGMDRLLEEMIAGRDRSNSIRNRRSTIEFSDINTLDGSYGSHAAPDTPSGGYYVRVFGNEIRYADFHDFNADDLADRFNFLNMLFSLAEERNIDLMKNSVILDAIVSVPTVAGMPIQLSAQAVSSVNVKVSGKFDVHSLLSSPMAIDIQGSLAPSAGVEVTGQMGVDAFVAKAGIKMVATMHTSTVVSGKVQVQDGKVLSVDWNLPRDRLEIFSAQSKFYITYRGQDREQRMASGTVVNKNECLDLAKTMGIELCAEASVPIPTGADTPLVPFTGPINVAVYGEKKDTFDKYMLQLSFNQDMNRQAIRTSTMEFVMDTPGSRVNRLVSLTATLDHVQYTAGINLRSPWKQFTFDGSLTNSDAEKGISLVARVDETTEYSLTIACPIRENNRGYELSPEIRLVWPGLNDPRIVADVTYIPERKIDFQMRLRNVFQDPARISGSLTLLENSERYKPELTLEIKTSFFTGTFTGYVDHQEGATSSRVTVEYAYGDGPSESIVLNNKVLTQQTAALSKMTIDSQWTSTLIPDYNGDVKLEMGYGPRAYLFNIDAGFDAERRLVVREAGSLKLEGPTKTINWSGQLTFPLMDWDYALSLDHMHNEESLSHKVEVNLPDIYQGLFETNMRIVSSNPLRLTGDLKVNYPGRTFEMAGEVQETGSGQYQQTGSITMGPEETRMSIVSTITTGAVIELRSTISTSNMDAWEITASIKPTLSDLEIHGRAQQGRQVYSTDFTMQSGGNPGRESYFSRTTFDLNYPDRHITYSQDFTYEAGQISGNSVAAWDVDRDPSQQTSTVYRMRVSKTQPALYIKTLWQRDNFVELDTMATYDSTMEVQGMFKSNIDGVDMADEYRFGVKYEPQANGGKLHVEGSVDDKKHEGDLTFMVSHDFDQHQIVLEITNHPWNTWRTIRVETSHEKSDRTLNMVGAFGWDGKEVRLVSENSINWRRQTYEGGVTLTTPWEDLEEIRLSVSHVIADAVHTTDVGVSWGGGLNKRLSYRQIMTIMPGTKFAIDSTFNSPWRGFEEWKLKSIWQRDNNVWSTENEVQWAEGRMVAVSSSLALRGPAEFDGMFRLTTPFEAFERIMMNINNNKRQGIWISHFDLEYAPTKKIEIDTQMDLTNYRKLFAQISCDACPYIGTTAFDLEFNGGLMEHTLKVELSSSRLLSENILLTTNAALTDISNMNARLDYRSPVGLRSLAATFQHRQSRRVYTTDITFTIPTYRILINNEVRAVSLQDLSATTVLTLQNDVYRFVTSIQSQPKLKISVMLHTPNPDWPLVGFEVTHEGIHTDFTTLLNITFGLNAKTMCRARFQITDNSLLVESHVLGILNKDLRLTLNSRGGFYDQMNTNFEFTYSSSQQPSTDMALVGSLTRYVPFLNDNLRVAFTHRGNIMDFTSVLTLARNENAIVNTFKFNMRGAAIGTSLEITTPSSFASLIKFELNHNGPINDFTNSITWRLNRQIWKMENKFMYRSSRLEVESKITTPVEGYESIQANFVHAGTLTDFVSDGSVAVSGQTATIHAEFSMRNKVVAKVDITAPFLGYRNINLNLQHNSADWTDFNSEFTFVVNRDTYRANIQFKWNAKVMQLDTSASTPDRRYGFNIRHRGDLSDFTTTVTITNPSGEINSELVWRNTPQGAESSLIITTPYNGYERFTVTLNHDGGLDNFDSSLAITTPFRWLPSGSISAMKHGDISNFAARVGMTWSETSMSVAANFAKTDMRFAAGAMIETSFEIFRKLGAEFAHEWSSEWSFTTTLSVETPFEKAETQSLTLNYRGPLNNMESTLTALTSVPGYDRFTVTVTSKLGEVMEASLSVTTPIAGFEQYELTLSHQGELSQFVTRLNAIVSISGSKRLSVVVQHRMENGMIDSSFELRTPWHIMSEVTGSVRMTPRNDGFDLVAGLNTPFENFEQQRLTISHSMKNEWADFDTTAAFTWARERQNINAQLKWDMNRRQLTGLAKITTTLVRRGGIVMDANLVHEFRSNGFNSRCTIEFLNVDTITVDATYAGERTNFEASANVEQAGKRIETECTFRIVESGTYLTWKLNRTPWEIVQNMEISGAYTLQGRATRVQAGLIWNRDPKLNAELSFTKTLPMNVHLVMRQPLPFEAVVNYNKEDQTHRADWTFTYDGATLSGDGTYTCRTTSNVLDRSLALNALWPTGRPVQLELSVYSDGETFRHSSVVGWERSKKITSNINLASSYARGRTIYNGDVRVTSPWANPQATVEHIISSGYQYTTTISVPGGITIVHDLTRDLPIFSHSLQVTHPRLSEGITYEMKGTIDPDHCKIEGEFLLKVEREELRFHGRVEDESGTRERVVAEATMTHSPSQTDFRHSTVYIDNSAESSLTTETNWMVTNDGMRRFALTRSYNKRTKDLDISIENPYMSVSAQGRQISDTAYEIRREANGKVYRMEWGTTDTGRYAQFAVEQSSYEPADFIRINADYNDMRNMNLEIFHSVRGQQVRDIQLGVTPQPRGNTIAARTYIRQNLFEDLASYWVQLEPPSEMLTNLKALYISAEQDVRLKQMIITHGFKTAFLEAFESMGGQTWRQMKTEWDRMLRDNDFYLSDIQKVLQSAGQLTSRALDVLKTNVVNNLDYYIVRAERLLGRKISEINEMVNALTARFLMWVEEKWPSIQDIHRSVEKVVVAIEETVEAIRNNPWVQSYFRWLENVKNGQFMRQVRQFRDKLNAWVDAMSERYHTHLAILKDVWGNFNRRAEIREMRAMLAKVNDWFEYVNDKYDVEETLTHVTDKLSSITWDVIKDRLYSLITSHSSWGSGNDIDVEVYIPTDFFNDIRPALPDLYIKESIQNAMQWLEYNAPQSKWTFWDYYFYYKAGLAHGKWMPPFKSWATLAGTQHFMTFDRRFYEFAGDCSYLLARDFVDREFAVIVNYRQGRRGAIEKTITVTDDYSQVEISSDGQVQKDGQSAEMPITMVSTSILRESNLIRITNTKGISVVCDLTYDRCTLHVSGWYYGKTAGLLGTYDNEPVTDLITPDGEVVDDIVSFARSWSVGRCRTRDSLAVTSEPQPGTRPYELCAAKFIEESSPFRNCFRVVEPEPFMKMCVNDFATDSNRLESEEVVCKTGAFYVDECANRGVNAIRLPEICTKCSSPAGEFIDSITLEENQVPHEADVVFVVQHADCNKEVVENLRDIISDLNDAMTTKGLADIRYGLVGYGGFGALAPPHAHTMDGQLTNSNNKMIQAIASWQQVEHGDSDTNADTIAAVEFAARYPFRTGASKTMILIPCEECYEHHVSYSDAANKLSNQDIRLHVIMQHDFRLKVDVDKGPQTAYLYGSDKEGIFTKKHLSGDLSSDRELFNLVKRPGDLCASMSEQSNGAIFDVSQFTQGRKRDQKAFLQVLVRVFADRAQPAPCQKCECIADSTGAPVSICRACTSNIFQMIPEFWKLDEVFG